MIRYQTFTSEELISHIKTKEYATELEYILAGRLADALDEVARMERVARYLSPEMTDGRDARG